MCHSHVVQLDREIEATVFITLHVGTKQAVRYSFLPDKQLALLVLACCVSERLHNALLGCSNSSLLRLTSSPPAVLEGKRLTKSIHETRYFVGRFEGFRVNCTVWSGLSNR